MKQLITIVLSIFLMTTEVNAEVVEVTKDNFEKTVLENEKPVVVLFLAEWCGPCKMVAPVIEDLSKEMKKTVVFAKVNVDENQETTQKYGIRGIPTLVIFKEGKVFEKQINGKMKTAIHTGALNKDQLKAWLNKYI